MFSDACTSFFLLKLTLAIQCVLQLHMDTIFFLFAISLKTAIVYNFERECIESSGSVLKILFSGPRKQDIGYLPFILVLFNFLLQFQCFMVNINLVFLCSNTQEKQY